MRKCVICGKVNGNVSYFKAPNDDRRRQQWSKACNMQLKPTAKVCSDHFLSSDFIVGARLALMPSAVPSVAIASQENTDSLNQINNSSGDDFHSLTEEGALYLIERADTKAENFVDEGEFDTMLCNDHLEEKSVNFEAKETTDYLYEMVVDTRDASDEELEVEFTNSSAQTDNDYFISTGEKECYKLRCEVKKLKCENSKLKRELESANSIIASMRNIFTEGQIRKMANPEKQINWRKEDIAACKSLYASGPRAYDHLYRKGFPLPHVSSLQRWARKVASPSLPINVDSQKETFPCENED